MKTTCFCGKTFRLSDIPRTDSFRVYDDVALDHIIEVLKEDILYTEGDHEELCQRVEDLFYGLKPPEVTAVECPHCRRLLVRLKNNCKISYVREKFPSERSHEESPTLLGVFEEKRRKYPDPETPKMPADSNQRNETGT